MVFDASTAEEVACFAPASGMRACCFLGNSALLCGGGDGTMYGTCQCLPASGCLLAFLPACMLAPHGWPSPLPIEL